MNEFEKGLLRYISERQLNRIQSIKVGIAGIGGLGSNCAALLVRCGFKKFTLVDFDEVSSSNLNRQYFFVEQIGQTKVKALAENLIKINSDLQLIKHHCKIDKKNINQIFKHCDVIIEAFDRPESKTLIVESFANTKKLLIAVSGIAGYGSSDRIKIRQICHNFYVVGDFVTDIEQVAPFAPCVNIAAAKQADLVLEFALGGINNNEKRNG